VEFYVILIDGAEAGRIYLHERAEELRLMDIALLPPFQRRGAGGALIKAVLDRATAKALKVGIHVESFNPAMRLYTRLGFVEVGRSQVYVAMEWNPGGPRPQPAA
jgi:GNAT superfamily N-acetyltransferase